MRRQRLESLKRQLADDRSHRIFAVSHCVLNENARYLGGAFRQGTIREVVDGFQDAGYGIYQMPCPEQRAWGGVLRPQMLAAYGSRGSLRYRLRRPLIWLFVVHTRLVYRRLARRVASDLADYERAGTKVAGIVGISSSPTCGVLLTTDVRRSAEVLAACPPDTTDRAGLNQRLTAAAVVAGQGFYVRALRTQLQRKRLDIPFVEHDLLAEMRGERSTVPRAGRPS